jgi:hypothetical protein
MRTRLFVWGATAGLMAIATSCSKGPEPPQPGTPAFYWNAARTTYHAGDFVKTGENLRQILSSDNEFTARSRPWAIVMSAGIARGYADTADAFEAGAKMNRANPMPFRKEMSALRTLANAATMELIEGVHQYMTVDKQPEVLLAFENPNGSATEPPNLRKIQSGQPVPDSEREAMIQAMVQRGVVLFAGKAVGSTDPAKTLELMKNGDAKRPRADFLAALAQELFDRTAIYGPTKLDLPNRAKMLCDEALEALKAGPDTKERKALETKINAALKKITGKT